MFRCKLLAAYNARARLNLIPSSLPASVRAVRSTVASLRRLAPKRLPTVLAWVRVRVLPFVVTRARVRAEVLRPPLPGDAAALLALDPVNTPRPDIFLALLAQLGRRPAPSERDTYAALLARPDPRDSGFRAIHARSVPDPSSESTARRHDHSLPRRRCSALVFAPWHDWQSV